MIEALFSFMLLTYIGCIAIILCVFEVELTSVSYDLKSYLLKITTIVIFIDAHG